MLFCCFLCVRVRAGSIAFVSKAQLSRLAQERRYAGLTAARQTLQELRVAICSARTAFPLTPLAVVAKQVCRALTLSLREKAAPHVPAHRRDVSAQHDTCADALPRLENQPVRPRPHQT